MWPINAQLHCSNYRRQLHVSATQWQSAGCLCEIHKSKSYTFSLHTVKNNMWKISQHYKERYVIVTHKQTFAVQKALYKIKQLGHIILKN